MHALIIDDSRAMRRILARIMKPLGFDIVEAANGQEGLDRLNETDDVEVILVDWNMPVMNGVEFVKTVRAVDQYRSTKIVMVTTETETAQMVRALMAGVDEFVMKPFTAEILVSRLRHIGVQMPVGADFADAV